MHVIPPALHRILDFVTVAAFALAPVLLGLDGVPALLAYALAAVHLTLTLLTRFHAHGRGAIPLRVHGAIELVVGLALLGGAFVLGAPNIARTTYIVAGVVILAVWLLSDYRSTAAPATTA